MEGQTVYWYCLRNIQPYKFTNDHNKFNSPEILVPPVALGGKSLLS